MPNVTLILYYRLLPAKLVRLDICTLLTVDAKLNKIVIRVITLNRRLIQKTATAISVTKAATTAIMIRQTKYRNAVSV